MLHRSGADCNTALTSEFVVALEKRAAVAITDLNRALKTHQENRNERTHKALVLAVTFAQHLVKLLSTVKEQRQRHSQLSGASCDVPILLFAQLESHRASIRRILPTAVAAAEASATDDAADTANALRSLLHTRSLLHLELLKVQGAVDELAGSSESLDVLQSALRDVNMTVEVAQRLVRKLLSVKSVDDVVLRLSALVFVSVVVYIIAQRVFGFFPTRIS